MRAALRHESTTLLHEKATLRGPHLTIAPGHTGRGAEIQSMTATNPMESTRTWLNAQLWALTTLHTALRRYEIDTMERMKAGGQLLPIGPGLAEATARGLSSRPDLFTDAPISGEELAAAQGVCYAWQRLRNRLRDMARLADDAYVSAQAWVNTMTVALVRKIMEQSHPPQVSEADIPLRNMALVPAVLVLHAYFRAINSTRGRNKARAAQAPKANATQGTSAAPPTTATGTAADPAAAPANPAPPGPAQVRAMRRTARARRDHDRAVVKQAYESFLRSGNRGEKDLRTPAFPAHSPEFS